MSKEKEKTEVKKVSANDITSIISTNNPSVSEVQRIISNKPEEIAAAVTGAIATGSVGLALSAGRLVQGALRGNFAKQFAEELNNLIETGKIPEDFTKKKFGFKSFTEVFSFIENEDIDEERFNAVKAMFYAMNKQDNSNELVNYELMKISKSISASQIRLLETSYHFFLSGGIFHPNGQSFLQRSLWLEKVTEYIGHKITTLIIQDAMKLSEKGLMVIIPGENSTITLGKNAGLTDLGIAFCINLSSYESVEKSNL